MSQIKDVHDCYSKFVYSKIFCYDFNSFLEPLQKDLNNWLKLS